MSRSWSTASFFCIALTTLYLSAVSARPNKVWSFNVDEGPAPPPEKGPPLSAHASRNRDLLKYQVTAIVGAYLVCVLVSLSLIVLVGRRLRRAALSNRSLDMEMVKPAQKTNGNAIGVDPSPVSPVKQWGPSPVSTVDSKQWPSPTKEKNGVTTWVSPVLGHQSQPSQSGSVVTFDSSVIESDKERSQREMERLYAAVMAHDAKKSNSTRTSQQEQTSPVSPAKSPRQYAAEVQQLRNTNTVHFQEDQVHTGMYPTEALPRSTSTTSSRSSIKLPKSPLAFFHPSNSRTSLNTSKKSKPERISIRNLPISPPMGSPDLAESFEENEETPLSPRLYQPGPPPPTPGQKAPNSTTVSVKAIDASELKARKPNSRAPAPTPLPLGSATPASSNTSLPFRSAYGSPPQSAPPTKTTVLEARESIMGPGPRTGMPQTPYSPYMPFTPLTPITPSRLVTKEDRKREKKMKKGYGGLRVLREDDMVKSDEEVWE